MAEKVADELFESIIGQLFEIGHQIQQPNGYPYDPKKLQRHLQAAIEGKFGECWKERKNEILELVGSTRITATTERFVVTEHFQVNTGANTLVKISWIGDNFRNWFLDLVEEPIDESVLDYYLLKESSLDVTIIKALGGELKAETKLTHVFALMKLQRSGEKGALLNNGYPNVFYVRDSKNVLRAVAVYGYWDGLHVHADSVSHPRGWGDGGRVFSSNSCDS